MSNQTVVEAVAEALHYAQGMDDYGVANDDERAEAEELANAALDAVASYFGLCRQDWEAMPCMTCGAGL
jgi:predicted component of type VI protein secretion system